MGRYYQNTLYLLILLFFIILIRTAWIADDAFLTMRTVDNFVNGYGLRWNILERVQIYTHPMWMFMLIALYFFIRDPFIVFYTLTIALSMVTVYLFANKFAVPSAKVIIGISILIFSKAFLDYSTSGLENPLTHLLVILFLWVFLQKENSQKSVLQLFFIAGLVAFNRMDTLLILLPALALVLYTNQSIRTLVHAGLGFSTFILWELFSLIYYGFPFPNTAYAKLGNGISNTLLFQQGFRYILDSIQRDPVTICMIALGIFLAIKSRNIKNFLIAAGVVLYSAYIIKIGGDFMSGRFFSVLILVAVVLIAKTIDETFSKKNIFLISFIVLLGLSSSNPDLGNTPVNDSDARKSGITDERKVYFQTTGLINIDWKTMPPNFIWIQQGIEHRARGRELSIGPTSGLFSFYAGPDLHIVDTHGLGDPLLARLPAIERYDFIIGHFFRAVPDGYWKFDRSFGDQIKDQNLHEYYDKLSILTRQENLFSRERLVTIWRFNTGYYDHLLNTYLTTLNEP